MSDNDKHRECSRCEAAARADIGHICDHVMEAMRVRALALPALGEAIATVARARLIERVAAGGMVSVELGDGRAFELWPRDETIYIGGWDHDGEVELRRFRGDFEDIAAEAVAAFIEECER